MRSLRFTHHLPGLVTLGLSACGAASAMYSRQAVLAVTLTGPAALTLEMPALPAAAPVAKP